MHLHEGVPGTVGPVLYTLRPDDQDPGPDFASGVSVDYEGEVPIDQLLWIMRQGRAYLDLHTDAHPDGELRANLTSPRFEDLSEYYCS